MNPYQIVSESLSNKVFYHGSHVQGLSYIEPRQESIRFKLQTAKIWVTEDIDFASTFTFKWTSEDTDGDSWFDRKNGKCVMTIPKKSKQRLLYPGSIYIVEDKNYKVWNPKWPFELYSDLPKVKVIKEIQYDTSLECMQKNGVILKFV